MKRLVVMVAALLALLVPAIATAQDVPDETPVRVEVLHDAEGWSATFHFPTDAQGWAFPRSNRARRQDTGWRELSWTVETAGVSLRRIDETDVLLADDGTVPRVVTVRFEPFAQDLLADYDPALLFTDGTLALFTGHFAVLPWLGNTQEIAEEGPDTEMVFRDAAGPLMYKGQSYDSATTRDDTTYVVFGDPKLVTTDHLAALIDPATPAWLRREMLDFLPQTFAIYADRLGERAGSGKPMVLSSWVGPTPELYSQGGSVLPGLLTIRLEGEGLVNESTQALQGIRWFIAHEGAHFWLGQTVEYETDADAWIMEGGANLLAFRLIEQIYPEYNAGTELANSWQTCLAMSVDKPLAGASERRDYDANYACGTVLGMIAEGAAQTNGGRDFFDFLAALVAANREDAGGDGIVSVDDWLGQLVAESGDAELAAQLKAFVYQGTDDPQGDLCAMLARVDRAAPGCAAVAD
ncbi:M1 family aminopeptidase [Citromicrobium bathyomarinum]